MIANLRHDYNNFFTPDKYHQFIADLNNTFQYTIPFRIAESPVFVPRPLKDKLLKASDEIIDFLVRPDFKKLTERSIPQNLNVPNETDHTLFLALDFAVTIDDTGEFSPQLIEIQGFPSLFGWQDFLANKYREHFPIPQHVSPYFGLTSPSYQQKFKKVLLGDVPAENTILLEIDPLKQNTAIDFLITEKITGVSPVHIGDVKREGRNLFYDKNGKRIPIHRIYNRVIFDELVKRTDLQLDFNLTQEVDVQWAGHPNWFFRISKFTMPFLKNDFVPECKFLNEYAQWPADLENYVLKPLFSFSGTGVVFHVTWEDLNAIPVSEYPNYLLQRKVVYEPVVQAPDGKVKIEIRLLFLWEEGQLRPTPVINLARFSRGEMIGVKFNKDKTWVGGSICFFES